MDPLLVVIGLILVALAFDFINGFHDAANSIATVVSTRVLSPGKAVIWAAFFNFVAAFSFGIAVAKTIGNGMIDSAPVHLRRIFAGLLARSLGPDHMVLGLPTSSSHALIGGYAGAAVAKAGLVGHHPGAAGRRRSSSSSLSPLIGLVPGYVPDGRHLWLFRRISPGRVDKWFRRMQLLSAGVLQPDARRQRRAEDDGHHHRRAVRGRLHLTVHSTCRSGSILIAHAAIGARHARRRLADHPDDGIEDHQAAAGERLRGRDRGRLAMLLATHFGIPVSTTHAITGASSAWARPSGLSAVRWGVAGQIVWAWVLTIPAAAAIGAATYWLVHLVGGVV